MPGEIKSILDFNFYEHHTVQKIFSYKEVSTSPTIGTGEISGEVQIVPLKQP